MNNAAEMNFRLSRARASARRWRKELGIQGEATFPDVQRLATARDIDLPDYPPGTDWRAAARHSVWRAGVSLLVGEDPADALGRMAPFRASVFALAFLYPNRQERAAAGRLVPPLLRAEACYWHGRTARHCLSLEGPLTQAAIDSARSFYSLQATRQPLEAPDEVGEKLDRHPLREWWLATQDQQGDLLRGQAFHLGRYLFCEERQTPLPLALPPAETQILNGAAGWGFAWGLAGEAWETFRLPLG